MRKMTKQLVTVPRKPVKAIRIGSSRETDQQQLVSMTNMMIALAGMVNEQRTAMQAMEEKLDLLLSGPMRGYYNRIQEHQMRNHGRQGRQGRLD
jgi:hypothetical protein